MQRTVDQMFKWEQDRKSKVFDMKRHQARQKREEDLSELEKGGRFVNAISQKYLSKKENMNQQVENRLLSFG